MGGRGHGNGRYGNHAHGQRSGHARVTEETQEQSSPSNERERLDEMEKALSEQLAEVRRMRGRLDDTQDQE